MQDFVNQISQAEAWELNDLLNAILQRYNDLFPDWDISTISLEKGSDRNEQLDRIINFLQTLKTN